MAIRAVVFDFNGVLVDDEHVHFELFHETLGELGIALSEREYHEEYLGFDDRGAFAVALDRAGQPHDREAIDRLIARKAARYRVVAAGGLRIFPGAAESVRAAAKLGPVAICSGALRDEVHFGLDTIGVRDLVREVVASEDTQRCKPDPEGYLLTLKRLRAIGPTDLQPGECLVIEDSLAGIQSALAAGMRPIAVAHTYTPNELIQAGALAVLDSLAELPTVLVETQHR